MEPDSYTIDVAGTVLEDLEVKVHEAGNGEFHWTAYAKNGRKIATTGETYQSADHAARMAHELFPTAKVTNARGVEFVLSEK
jgi:uncharacterized protein DUF1508